MFTRFDRIHERARRTDGRTDRHRMTTCCACIASRGKNGGYDLGRVRLGGGVDLLPYTVLPLPRVATRRLIEFHCARVGDIGLLRCLRRGRVGRHNAIVGELCDCFESGNINRRRCRAPSVLTC